MSTIWAQRKAKLRALLGNDADEEGEGLALDGILHGQAVIGRTRMWCAAFGLVVHANARLAKTVEIDKLRFSEKDLVILGPLAAGQFGKARESDINRMQSKLTSCARLNLLIATSTTECMFGNA